MSKNKYIVNLLFAGLVVFLIIGTGQLILNSENLYGVNDIGPYMLPANEWVSSEFVGSLRNLISLSFIYSLIALIMCVLSFIVLDIVWNSEKKTGKIIKSIIQIVSNNVIAVMLYLLFDTHGRFQSRMLNTNNNFYSVSLARDAQGLLFIPIICLVAILLITIPLSIINLINSLKDIERQKIMSQ